jgi:hypothetical protein
MTGTNFSDWYNATEGTFAVNYRPYVVGASTVLQAVFDASLAGRASFMSLYKRASTDVSTRFNVVTSGSASVMFSNIGTFTAADNKAVCAYKVNNSAAALNGGSAALDNDVAIPTVDTLGIGSFIDGNWSLNGAIQKLYYFPQRLTNAEVQAFSKG